MDIKDILAALSGVLNGLPQGLLALAFGFASVPTALAFLTGAVGNAFAGSVVPISFQAETITLAGTMGKNIRERLSMIFFGALMMVVIGMFGLLQKIIEGIGSVITSGMMAGVGIILAKVSLDMAKNNKLVGFSSIAISFVTYMATKDLVYAITFSVFLSSGIYLLQKKERAARPVVKEKFVLHKPLVNATVIRGALAMVTLNIGANIAFGGITGDLAKQGVNVDHLSVISGLADMASSLFGGGPVEAIISATASAPHPVWSGILMMLMFVVILWAGWLPKIGRFIPSESIAGFLFVLGAIVTVPGNAAEALGGADAGGSVVGAVTMTVTAITDPFIGMITGLVVQWVTHLV
ncbi:hypothetical protein [Numidum massiliense]|uniref:hypothetical protein n=1 Tax=Numidum massiliense TaxID=1522315 RepID=UPI0006D56E90|nr:hypothetical protein [Numidum massiliense]